MPKKLAITIAGAVSLGSYESGVAFEVLDAISQHNAWAAAKSPDNRIEIDVLTGASAGGMTVAIIAQRLLFDGNAMSDPYNNPLYNAWVQQVDISGLLALQKDEPVTHSVFSSDCVIGISKTFLTGRYTNPPQPPAPAQPHPALPLNGSVHLGLALSNINGVDYDRNTSSGGQFTYTDHEDQHLFSLDASSDTLATWEPIRSSAVACGAFPIAFRVQDLLRDIADYDSPDLVGALWGGQSSRYFTYTDGGLLQNQPLGMAKNFVDNLPGGHLHTQDRGYLFVAPHPRSSSEIQYTTDASAAPASAFGAANATFKAVATRLAGTVVGQAAFQDWITAENVNDKIALLDRRASELQRLYLNGQLTALQTGPVSQAILGAMFRTATTSPAAVQASIAAASDQLRQQYSTEYAMFGADTVTAEAWLQAVLVLELAAGLHEKDQMLIYDFVADASLLAGDQLEAFEGFFDVSYRKHDYDYGRQVAQTRLQMYAQQPGSLFANLHWTPKPIDPINPALNNLQMSQVDKTKRQQVYQQMCTAADNLLQELGVSIYFRKPLMWWVVGGQIKKVLAL
jgi:hypothetical protein